MKIIDFEKKGNVVKFFLGRNDLKEWWGDDWDDRPYEHNAGEVYDKFVSAEIDVAFPSNWIVSEPADDYHYNGNSPYCKEDFIKRKAPCIVAYKPQEDEWWCYDEYSTLVSQDNAVKFYFGDKMDNTSKIVIFDQNTNFKVQKFGIVKE